MLSDEELSEMSRRLFVDPHLNVVAAMPPQEFAQVMAQAREANALRAEVERLRAEAVNHQEAWDAKLVESASLRARAALADEQAEKLNEARLTVGLSSWGRKWLARYDAATREDTDGR